MCGRFVRDIDLPSVASFLGAQEMRCDLEPGYNVAPTQPVVVCVMDGRKTVTSMRWGLVPPWSHDPGTSRPLINARLETIFEKPSFSTAIRRQRCLIVATGFYEWQTVGTTKVPQFITLSDQPVFCMAGIYTLRTGPDGLPVATCAIITTAANSFMQTIHHRMPVIITPARYDQWIDPALTDPQEIVSLITPTAPDTMTARPVSPAVNDVHNDFPGILTARTDDPAHRRQV